MEVFACTDCGHVVYPARLLCPRCGAAAFVTRAANEGVLEEATTNRAGSSIGSVRTDAGPIVLARLVGDPQPGERVRLRKADGVEALR